MTDFRIRPARPEDGVPARELVFGVLRSYGITPEPEGLDADVMTFGQASSEALAELVAEKDGAVVGVVALSSKGPGVGWVSKLFVAKEQRRGGIGRALLARAVDEARARGMREVGLRRRTIFREACALYEATGWKRGVAPTDTTQCDRTYWLTLR